MNSLYRGAATLAVLAGLSTPALASNGLFDFVDPCIQARDSFSEQRTNMLSQLNQAVVDADHQPAPAAYRDLWLQAMKEKLRPKFDELVAPSLRDAGVTNMDDAYGKWFTNLISKMGQDDVTKLVDANFHQELRGLRLSQQTQGIAQLQAAQGDLDHSCKMDVGNQALRVTLGAVMAPFGIAQRNAELFQREPTVVGKALAVGGVSLTDIGKYGPAGGPNSVINQAGNFFAKIGGW
jgi:hypothetical protein